MEIDRRAAAAVALYQGFPGSIFCVAKYFA
jgi:hypothetical protein